MTTTSQPQQQTTNSRPTYLPTGITMTAHRPVIKARKGMITSAHYAASMAGLRMFVQGGNAVDAVVAAAAALNVVEPYMSGMGGIGMLVMSRYHGKERKAFNFTGLVPHKAVPEAFSPQTHSVGTRCPLVPGNPAGWLTLLEKHGKLSRSQVLTPAIELAEEGYVVSELDAKFFEVNMAKLEKFPTTKAAYYPHGRPLKAGEILVQKDLGRSFRILADKGLDGFYRGPIAEEIERFMKANDGLIDKQDLRDYKPAWEEPIAIKYKGFDIITNGPNSNAFQVLETLNILESFDVRGLGHNSADYIHLVSEAIKLAATDRIMFGGDPNFMDVPIKGLLSKTYARDQRLRINHYRASTVMGERYTDNPPPGSFVAGKPAAYTSGETTHLAAADSEGTVVSLTQTLGAAFGCSVVIGNTGFIMNNNIDLMDIKPGSGSNLLVQPGKRPGSNMAPIQVFKDGKFLLSIGTPGSYGIPQTTTQMILNYIEFGMNLQEALEAPRFRVMGGVQINMEDRISKATRDDLERRGHKVGLLGEWTSEVGGGHALSLDQSTGVLMGGADPRRDGYALGF
ncbi:MAG: gamma-glutamyltransferase [SAR202 cluster bacterium]|nr:gamma-glutamyltransferase [SAR202 cluster bacterium]